MTESKRKHMVLLLLLMIIPMIIFESIIVVNAADRSDVSVGREGPFRVG